MKRKIISSLIAWKKQSNGRTALLIDGARRVGKSYVAVEFAKQNYKTYLVIDFNEAGDEIRSLFDGNLRDLDSLFMNLQVLYGVKLYQRKSLIIFDDIQLCPRARAAIKFLVADGRYDYLETGSLLSIKENVKDILIPSEEHHLRMYPMDFEEFLWARNEQSLWELIKQNFEKRKPLGETLHRKAMSLFREYLIIGGMPQVVDEYTSSRDFEEADRIKKDILELYRADISKHGNRYAAKIKNIFDEIPSELSRHNKAFTLSVLGRGASYRSYETSFLWLEDSMIVNVCYNSTSPNLGLKLNRDHSSFKVYMGDTGLLISMAFDENGKVPLELYRKLLTGKLEVNEGMIFENIVAQMLKATGHSLYFYSNPSRNDKNSRMEIDFLVAKSRITNSHNVSPIEVKSGKNYTLSSLNKFRIKFKEELHTAYVLHTEDLWFQDEIVYLPVYMTPLL